MEPAAGNNNHEDYIRDNESLASNIALGRYDIQTAGDLRVLFLYLSKYVAT